MRKAKVNGIERLEHYLVKLIQQPGADENQPLPIRILLTLLHAFSYLFRFCVAIRYWFYDIGLLRRMADVPASVILDGSPYYTEFKGAMTENYVLGELIKGGNGTAYYWNSGNTAEVDFIIQCDKYIVPIEVKSEKNVKSRSLAEYRRRYDPEYAVKTSMKPETTGKEVLNLPLWVIGKIDEIIKAQ